MESDEPSPSKTIVFFSNTSEDVWPFIKRIGDEKIRAWEIEENALLSDRDLFSLTQYQRLVFVTPRPVSTDYLEYYQALFGAKQLEILVPQNHTGQLCVDAQEDKIVWNRLKQLGKESSLTILGYSTTTWLLALVARLRKLDIVVETPESPDRLAAWTVNFFGSKTGIRQLISQMPPEEAQAPMSTGFIISGVTNGANLAAARHILNHGVVIKTQKGHAGAGVLIFRPNDLPSDFELARDQIVDTLVKDDYWSDFPMVVEDYVDADLQIAGGFPSAEFKVEPDGRVTFLYACGMRVTPAGTFMGVEIHHQVVPPKMLKAMMAVGEAVGREYARYGYRGYFDLDFAISKDKQVFVTESNVRRTGGTHVYHTAMRLLGPDFLKLSYIVSNNGYVLPGKKFSFPELVKILKPLAYNPKTKSGLMICGENLLSQGKMAYVIFGQNREQTLKIEADMEKLLLA